MKLYRGTNPGDTRRIRTGNSLWDSQLFVTDDPEKASFYGSHVQSFNFPDDAKILREGSQAWRSLMKGFKPPSGKLLEIYSEAVRRAISAGYDLVWFKMTGDTGIVVLNRDLLVQESAARRIVEAAAFVPSGRTMRIGDLPRGIREDLFNMYAVSVNPEATEATFYRKRIPLGVLTLNGVVVSRIPDAQIEPYLSFVADLAQLPPLVVADGKLIDGQHRILAARKLGMSSLPAVDATGLIDTSPESMGYVSVLPA